ncbi:zinc-binding dehydrogenase [Rhodococcus kronopolitis]|uniref:Zinc-binding dehydrogenase n=1 Tax=Rhodococcus kronopolitis TaxID=1460226 RepID=A0ABV9FQQ4_9NOCA
MSAVAWPGRGRRRHQRRRRHPHRRSRRINTLADGAAIRKYGVHSDAQEEAASPALWAALADLAADGQLSIPIDQVYPLAEVRQAYRDVATRHTSGKRVLSSIIAPGERRE